MTAGLALLFLLGGPLVPLARAQGETDPGALADRIAATWPARQTRGGLFVDPVTGKTARGYGAIMLGYGLLWAGVRRGEERLVRSGVRAVSTALAKPPGQRGVFDALGVAAAYDLARRRLGDDPAFRRTRRAWAAYLRTTGPPALDPGIAACISSPGCFHNHEAVEAAGDLALLRTRLRSTVPGSKLDARAATRGAAVRLAGVEAPGALRPTGRSTGPGPRRGLGLISDANTYPLAYHALSAAMIGEVVLGLGGGAPPAGLRLLRRAVEAQAAFAGPDGDLAFIGRRQEQSWPLAATAYAATAAAAAFAEDRGSAARYRALAARALDRLERVHGVSREGIAVVPRFRGRARGGFAGLDFSNTVVWNGLTVFLLDRAAEVARREPSAAPAAGAGLTADGDGAFVDAAGAGFATVRRGGVWFAVNGRPLQPDLRYDAGLVALKRRSPDGTWRDLLRPRPMTLGRPPSSAGPVLVSGGREWFPYGRDVRVGRRGVVTLRAAFADSSGAPLGRTLAIRYTPLPGGVRVSFPLRAGDGVRLRTFLPARSARRTRAGAVRDRDAVATLRPRPSRVTFQRGFASCCDARLVEATMDLTTSRPRVVTYTVLDRRRATGRAAGAGVGMLARG